MAFEKFKQTGRSYASKVSISPRGMISFTDGARHRFGLDKYDLLFCTTIRKPLSLEWSLLTMKTLKAL